MKEKVIEYFNKEYEETVRLFETKPFWFTNPKESVYNTIQRCLGVVIFAQEIDSTLSYDEINIEYEIIREKLKNLLKNA